MNHKIVQRSLLPKSGAVSSPLLLQDAVATGSEVHSKRRCISSACMPCRKRKSKCDGIQPNCYACTTTYHSKCYYDINSDHRRKGALRRDIGQLKEDLGSRNAILDAIRRGSQADVDEIVELIRSNPDDGWDSVAESVEKLSLGPTEKMSPSSYLEGETDSFSVHASENPGDTRQYGHTSNLTSLPDDNVVPTSEISQGATWTNVTNDNELIKHLLDMYLAWSHPLYMLFPEDTFLYGMQERNPKYCTPFLVNAILAVGCHFSDRPEARANPTDPSTVGDHFFAEALRLFQENNRSSLTNIQALALMSLHQAMNNDDSSGWLYIWQALGMVTELGLHTNQPTQSNGKMTESEIVARRVTLWGCYFLQVTWAVCVGRISILPRAAIRIEKQGVLDHLENKVWIPSGHSNYPGLARIFEQPGLRYTIFLHSTLLMEVVDDVLQVFYASRDRITSRKLHLFHEKFLQWHKALPESLAIKDTPTLPQVISLHIYYHNSVIQLFRPFLRYHFIQNKRTPLQIATEAANKISELVALYARTYGFRRSAFVASHCIVTAAVIHVVNLSPSDVPPGIREQSEIHIANALSALYEINQNYPVVVRFLKFTRVLISRWCPIIPQRIQEVLEEIDMTSPISTSSNPSSPISALYADPADHTNEPIIDNCKPSIPDLNPPNDTAPSDQSQLQSQNPDHQSLFWNSMQTVGVEMPLSLPPEQHIQVNQPVNITSMLDPSDNVDWSQLNRDGFIMGEGGERSAVLWEVSWDNQLGL